MSLPTLTVPSWVRALRAAVFAAVLGTAAAAAAAGTTYYNIDQKTGWASCTVCAGAGGDGPVATYSSQQGIASPSLDGKSMQFNLGGSTPYSNALWWKQLGANSTVQNFQYDLYYYIKNPSASQALEFDVNQSVNGKKYIFGTECDFKDKKVWKVYDPYNRAWQTTSIACTVPKAYTWHHVVLEFQRTATAKVSFLAVTINGTKSYFNRLYDPKATAAKEINVAFQMDGNKSQTDYSVWLDKVTLTYW